MLTLHYVSGMFPTDDEVGDLLEHIDDDGSGMVDYSELMKHMAAQVSRERFSSDLSHPEHFRSRSENPATRNTTLKRLFSFLIRTESMNCVFVLISLM